jgi:hypothetical protein
MPNDVPLRRKHFGNAGIGYGSHDFIPVILNQKRRVVVYRNPAQSFSCTTPSTTPATPAKK